MDGNIALLDKKAWFEDIEPDSFRRRLVESGLSDDQVEPLVQDFINTKDNLDQFYARKSRRIFSSHPGSYYLDAGTYLEELHKKITEDLQRFVRESLGRYQIKIVNTKTVTEKIPLFKFHSPQVDGSEVIYKETNTNSVDPSWNVKILGSGLGSTVTYEVSYSDSFKSANGDYKLVFVPVKFKVNEIEIYKGDAYVTKGYRAEAIAIRKRKPLNKGIDLLSREILISDLSSTKKEEGETFPLSGDQSSTIATYTRGWSTDGEFEANIGLAVFDSELSMGVKVRRKEKIDLTFKLPVGRDYRLKAIHHGYGFVWEVDPI